MKFSALEKFLTNNHCFSSDHPEYRRVYLFNTITLLFFAVTVCFTVLCAIAGFYIQSAVHGAGTVLCVIVMIVFRRTNSLKACSYALIALMTCILAVMFYACGHARYIFIWVSVFPPMVFFLLGRKKALITSVVFLSCMLVYMLLSYKNWEPGVFSPISIINIFSSAVALILLINYFETSRREAVESVFKKNRELEEANLALQESRERLRLILDSTAEAIFGIDMECRCTFCNTSCLELLGLDNKNELLGKDMHELLHHSKRDGAPLPREACQIIKTCMEGAASHMEDEVFWRANGTSFDVEYNSYPQYKDGELVGAVVTFTDNTIKRMHEQQIEYFSSHDTLTGLFNRNHFEHLVKKADIKSNLPISVIMGDVNGLKLMNDVFGHAAGDELLVKAAEAIKKVCREDELIARLGGDEFVILL
ncbi:MAG: diguanylate cyclase, partial [Clostridiales bacterium]|nr:diguanylate cyclase [Clostridiales bacterium]